MQNTYISQTIKLLCKNQKVSLVKLQNDCGLSKSFIYDLEKRSASPSCLKITKIADYLNCSVDYLLGRTNNPKINTDKNIQPTKIIQIKNKIIPLYMTGASAGTGNWLSDDIPVRYMTVPQNDKTANADFMIKVSGDSMQPRFFNNDILLIKKTPAILVGEIGIFIVNGDSFVKKMGNGELISLNPTYDNIKLTEFDDVSCAGKVIDTINLDNYS